MSESEKLPAQLRFTVELDWVGDFQRTDNQGTYPELWFYYRAPGVLTVTGPLPVLFRWLRDEYSTDEAELLWNELTRRDWLTG